MARKTRKQKQRAAARRQPPATPGGAGIPAPTSASVGTVEAPDLTPAADGPPIAAEFDTAAIASVPAPLPGPVDAQPVVPMPAAGGGRRRIERLSSPATSAPTRQARVPSTAATMFAPLESDDAAIPFDRVPYVPADLRRVAVIAGLMLILIIIAAVVVSHIVT
jgi:hypothetical protein